MAISKKSQEMTRKETPKKKITTLFPSEKIVKEVKIKRLLKRTLYWGDAASQSLKRGEGPEKDKTQKKWGNGLGVVSKV